MWYVHKPASAVELQVSVVREDFCHRHQLAQVWTLQKKNLENLRPQKFEAMRYY